jgi:hypothetical protein
VIDRNSHLVPPGLILRFDRTGPMPGSAILDTRSDPSGEQAIPRSRKRDNALPSVSIFAANRYLQLAVAQHLLKRCPLDHHASRAEAAAGSRHPVLS